MKQNGWIKLYRGWMENPIFHCNDMKIAWLWLLENASHKEKEIWIKGAPVLLKRGQLSYSIRYLSTAWRCTPKRARVFLEKLEKGHMIGQTKGTTQNIITICNYTKYQDLGQTEGQTEGRTEGQERGKQRGTNNKKDINKKDKEYKKATEKYLFEGETFRLNERDYNSFRKRASNLTDQQFHNALTDCDFYYRKNGSGNVFHKIGPWLDKENKAHDKKILSYL